MSLEDAVEVTVHALGVDHDVRAPVLLLREQNGDSVVPLWIGASEARAIAVQLGGGSINPPMTHDLLADVVRRLGGCVPHILIFWAEVTCGRATVHVKQAGIGVDVEARASDAVALALRLGARIFVTRGLLHHGSLLDSRDNMELDLVHLEAPGVPPPSLADYLRSLSPEDLGRYHP